MNMLCVGAMLNQQNSNLYKFEYVENDRYGTEHQFMICGVQMHELCTLIFVHERVLSTLDGRRSSHSSRRLLSTIASGDARKIDFTSFPKV